MDRARRHKRYFVLMAICLVLFVSAWAFVRLWSIPAAVGMCVVAMVIPPVAAVIGNRREPGERWFDEQDGPGDDPSDRPGGRGGGEGSGRNGRNGRGSGPDAG